MIVSVIAPEKGTCSNLEKSMTYALGQALACNPRVGLVYFRYGSIGDAEVVAGILSVRDSATSTRKAPTLTCLKHYSHNISECMLDILSKTAKTCADSTAFYGVDSIPELPEEEDSCERIRMLGSAIRRSDMVVVVGEKTLSDTVWKWMRDLCRSYNVVFDCLPLPDHSV